MKLSPFIFFTLSLFAVRYNAVAVVTGVKRCTLNDDTVIVTISTSYQEHGDDERQEKMFYDKLRLWEFNNKEKTLILLEVNKRDRALIEKWTKCEVKLDNVNLLTRIQAVGCKVGSKMPLTKFVWADKREFNLVRLAESFDKFSKLQSTQASLMSALDSMFENPCYDTPSFISNLHSEFQAQLSEAQKPDGHFSPITLGSKLLGKIKTLAQSRNFDLVQETILNETVTVLEEHQSQLKKFYDSYRCQYDESFLLPATYEHVHRIYKRCLHESSKKFTPVQQLAAHSTLASTYTKSKSQILELVAQCHNSAMLAGFMYHFLKQAHEYDRVVFVGGELNIKDIENFFDKHGIVSQVLLNP